jgi:hypothetical protein
MELAAISQTISQNIDRELDVSYSPVVSILNSEGVV